MKIDEQQLDRHMIYLERLASGILARATHAQNQKALDDIMAVLADESTTLAQVQKVTARIEKILLAVDWTETTGEMEEAAEYESGYVARSYDDKRITITEGAATEIASATMMTLASGKAIRSGLWVDHINDSKRSNAMLVNSIVRNGYERQLPIGDIKKQVRQAFAGTIDRETEALVRTGFQHYVGAADEAVALENSDLLQEWYYVVTFDNRTSDVCIAITKFNAVGKRFKVGDPMAPRTPLHWRCRTRRRAVPKGWLPTGNRASVGGEASGAEAFARRSSRIDGKKVIYRGKRDASIFKPKPISAKLDFDAWLREQPDWFIDDTLGKKRAELFRNGRPLSSFSDMTGRPLTLKEIAARDAK